MHKDNHPASGLHALERMLWAVHAACANAPQRSSCVAVFGHSAALLDSLLHVHVWLHEVSDVIHYVVLVESAMIIVAQNKSMLLHHKQTLRCLRTELTKSAMRRWTTPCTSRAGLVLRAAT